MREKHGGTLAMVMLLGLVSLGATEPPRSSGGPVTSPQEVEVTGVVLDRDPGRRPAVREAMRERVAKVLAVAAHHGHTELVLGAWGCGVFGNDGREIAELFRDALAGP